MKWFIFKITLATLLLAALLVPEISRTSLEDFIFISITTGLTISATFWIAHRWNKEQATTYKSRNLFSKMTAYVFGDI